MDTKIELENVKVEIDRSRSNFRKLYRGNKW